MMKGVADVGRERDFVDRAPPGLIPEDVLARYNRFRPKRAGDGRANEPPEYDLRNGSDVPRILRMAIISDCDAWMKRGGV